MDAIIAMHWHDQPQAAAMTRTYARSMLRDGIKPDVIAKRIVQNGEVIE